VDTHKLPASQLSVNHHGFFRIYVLRLENAPGLIGSDGQNCQIKRSKHLTDLIEDRTVASISRIKDIRLEWSFNYEPSPKSSVVSRSDIDINLYQTYDYAYTRD
jgi:hypothetical protein